ncbi:MAG: HDOD domain-containing protein [Planctomycetes bacterium]|nr:HDOD domain-containing protein [Planctomycetota bacterium]
MAKQDVARLLERVAELNTLPEVTQRILSITEDPDASARDLNEVLKHDMALSAKLLRVVNSAFYGLPGRVSDLDRAIVLLGFQAVRNLAVAATMASLFSGEGKSVAGFSAKKLWTHCVATGVAARNLVNVAGFRSLREEAFLAGIIHDIGVLVEYQFASDKFAQVADAMTGGKTLVQAEQGVLDMTHEQIGQALAEVWKFPRNMQFVTGYHHKPTKLADEHRLLPVVVAVAEQTSNGCGYTFLSSAAESEDADVKSLCDLINVGAEDLDAIRENLPAMVEQASGWLEV